MPPSRFYLSLHQLRAAVGIVQPRLPGVESHLVPLARDAVAANDKELPPPQQTTSHNEILLLALVSKEAPPLVVGGEMGQPSPTSNSNPAPGRITSCVSDRPGGGDVRVRDRHNRPLLGCR